MRIFSPITTKVSEWWHSKPDPNRRPWVSRDTLYKVAIIGLCFLVIFGICFPVAAAQSTSNCKDGQCSDSNTNAHTNSFLPYAAPLQGRAIPPHSEGVIKTFPVEFSRMFHTSFMSNSLGNRYCSIEKGVPKPEDCDYFSKHAEELIQLEEPEALEQLKQQPGVFEEKGVILKVLDDEGTNIPQINCGNNPQKLENQKQFLKYLEQNVLQDPDFFSLSPKDILNAMKQTHVLIMNQLPNPTGQVKPGQFRNHEMYVQGDTITGSEEKYVEAVKKNGGTKKDVAHFKKALSKMKKDHYFEDSLKSFTERELQAFKLFAHIPPSPHEIEGEMNAFAEEFQKIGIQVINREVDPIAAAAWAHQEIGRIHPFLDGNGRFIRGWMNALLQLGGYEAVVFPDDRRYSEEVRKDQLNPGSFVRFLNEIVEWNQKQRKG